ncbi:MAG TPA: RNA polymerase sigma factor [Labilithrix sp.]|nr:RNA polymerase sigma factor [Labilithrix sp.]
MGVEEHYPEKHGDDDDGHVVSVGPGALSGQVSVVRLGRPGDGFGELNADAESGIRRGVTAAASTAFLSAIPFAPTKAHIAEDEGLLRRAGAGDAAAFREIFVRHRGDVARLVYRMLSAPADVEDVVQEVFVQVYKSLKDFRGQSKFSTWLHRVTVNVVLMYRRSARSRPVLTEEAPSEVVADERQPLPDEDAERAERLRAFQRLLGRLAEKKRVVFVLHELEGLPPSEIADIVGAPVLTVRTRLFYARRELEEMLAEEPSLANLRASFTKPKEEP